MVNMLPFSFREEDEKYYRETLYASLVIASRVVQDEKTSNDICDVGTLAVEWALKLQDPDHALGVCKALLKMCERMIPDRNAEVLYFLGQCHFTLVIAIS